MTKIQIPHKFECRDYQIPVWEALLAGKKKIVCCWHRGAGKDLFALNFFISKMIEDPAVYLHCFPQYSQGKKAIWNSRHDTDDGETIAYLDHFPPELVKYKNSSDMRIELVNGAVYQVMGIDGKNAQLARGMNPKYVIVSEYAYMNRESWETIQPRVLQNKGTVIFLSTPNGKNHFYHLYNEAKEKANDPESDSYCSLVTNEMTHLVSDKQIQDARDSGTPEDFIQQEFYCDFTKGAQGSYYGKYIQDARNEDRITSINIKREIMVHTAWDIGIGDSTAIWFYQILGNNKINLLHYYENNNEGLEHYIHYLDDWKTRNKAIYGFHYAPHDMANRELTTGIDRLTTVRNMGLDMRVLPRKPIEEGIQAARSLLPHCTFDKVECKRGIECLDFYIKKYNEALKVYSDTPLHNQWSHGADAFRMLAQAVAIFGSTTGKLTKDQIDEMRKRNYGY